MNRPLFSELSITEKIALLTELAERYAKQGGVPDFIFRAEMAPTRRGTLEERLDLLEWLLPFFAGWARVRSETVARDLNDPDYFQEDEPTQADLDLLNPLVNTWLSLNDEAFREALRAKGAEAPGDALPG